MNKQAIIVFGFITAILFFGGVLGVFFTARHLINIRELEKSDIIEEAIITSKLNRVRTFTNDIYFITISDNKTHRFHLMKLNESRVGDRIEVKFNEDMTKFLVTDFKSTTYFTYIFQIFLFLICFILSIMFLRATIEMYKSNTKHQLIN